MLRIEMTPSVASRVWNVSCDLRKRSGWRIASATIQRSWPNRINAVVSVFLDTARGAGVVVGVFAPSTERTRIRFRDLHARLGTEYRLEDERKQLGARRVLRGTTQPSVILRELR